VRRSPAVLFAVAVSTATVGAGATSALAAASHVPAAPAVAAANPGAASPSLSVAVSAGGTPEAAVIGKDDSLWYYTRVKGKWRATKLSGSHTAYSGPSVVSGPGSNAAVAVEGKSHSLLLFVTDKGHWVRLTVAGKNSAYSAPSLAIGKTSAGIAVLGKSNSLWYYSLSGSSKFHRKEIFSSGYAYSAPSLVIRSGAQASAADPAGEADIAVEASSHALYYVHSPKTGTSWQNAVVAGPSTTYSAPSLAVLSRGDAFIATEGAHHSLAAYTGGRGWSGRLLLSGGWVYSAPSVAVNLKDPGLPISIAYQGGSSSVAVILLNTGATVPGWQNDPLSSSVGNVDSAPALAAQPAGPAGQLDLIVQGKGNSLWLYQGPKPAIPLAPSFTGTRIGKPGSAYGG
jgi:hypothetical protein